LKGRDVYKIKAAVATENVASIKLLEKHGFIYQKEIDGNRIYTI